MQYAPLPCLAVRESPAHGLGVFTSEAIPAGTVVERAAVLESLRTTLKRHLYNLDSTIPLPPGAEEELCMELPHRDQPREQDQIHML